MLGTNYEQWLKSLEDKPFEESSAIIRDKILESPEMDENSKSYFRDAFEYVTEVTQSGKPLDPNLMKIRLMEIKNHNGMTMQDFVTVLMLLSLCGFQFEHSSLPKEEK